MENNKKTGNRFSLHTLQQVKETNQNNCFLPNVWIKNRVRKHNELTMTHGLTCISTIFVDARLQLNHIICS